ncbi:MAG: hypothetical protein K8T89_09325 [Planctomycetes bacterium]|nr:hypothetical protein [Planctomycetota bacterium]
MKQSYLALWLSFAMIAGPAFAEEQQLIIPVSKPRLPRYAVPDCPPSWQPSPPAELPKFGDPKTDPKLPAVEPKNEPAGPNQLAGATETGTQPGAMFNPTMFGDLIGISGCRIVTIPNSFTTIPIFGTSTTNSNSVVTTNTTNTTNTTTTVTTTVVPPDEQPPFDVIVTTSTDTVTNTNIVTNTANSSTTQQVGSYQVPTTQKICGVPIVARYNGFKVTDNETPRPVDRVYVTYNNFQDVNRAYLPATIPSVTVQRQMVGFEKTYMGGDASIGMRLPYIQVNGFSDPGSNIVGDLNILFKYAWINNPQTGNVFSTGMILTLPTGNSAGLLADGSEVPHSTLFQPWAGFIYNFPRIYVQGFTSLVAPTDSRDLTILFNSISAGYWLYRTNQNQLLSAIVPVVEVHVNTPLNHRTQDDIIFFKDQVNLTAGVYTMFRRLTVGAAIGVPVVGPRMYDYEAIVNANLRF